MEVPVLFDRKEECCGCSACYAICLKHAITMEADNEGFLYPTIKSELCVGCHQCLRVCPLKQMDGRVKN